VDEMDEVWTICGRWYGVVDDLWTMDELWTK
jgi:hypothetical protein